MNESHLIKHKQLEEKFTIDRKDIEFFEKIGSGQFGVNFSFSLILIKLE
jgi:hypothetical protein